MGLDCIPADYPCKLAGTATVGEDERIDCAATQAAGGCPWKRDSADRGIPVLGMFGTDCWYRGKAGNWMLERLAQAGYEPPCDFYGDQCDAGDGPDCTPGGAKELGRWMAQHGEAYAQLVGEELAREAELPRPAEEILKDELEEYRYAAWWAGWVATAAGGWNSWY